MKKLLQGFGFAAPIWAWFKQQRLWVRILVPILIIGALVFGVSQLNKTSSDLSYQFTTVKKTTITQTVSETGEVTSSNKVGIESSIVGIVKTVAVKNGQPVKRGDTLFMVTATATEAERTKAYADYLSAKNNLAAAQSKQNNLEATMWQSHETFVTKALDQDLAAVDPTFIQTNREWLAAEANYKNQTQVISAAQAAVTTAWLNYQATLSGPVKATADGTIANLSIAPGQTVAADDEVLTIKTTSENWVKVAINENDVVNVKPEQTATITIDAIGKTKLTGKVMRVDEFATIISEVPVYYVYIALAETQAPIRPGMTAQVEVVTQQKADVLAVPSSALKPYQGAKAVQVLDASTQTVLYQPVQIGIADDTMTEVTSGLTEGQEIILSSSTGSSSTSSTSSRTGTSGQANFVMRGP